MEDVGIVFIVVLNTSDCRKLEIVLYVLALAKQGTFLPLLISSLWPVHPAWEGWLPEPSRQGSAGVLLQEDLPLCFVAKYKSGIWNSFCLISVPFPWKGWNLDF